MNFGKYLIHFILFVALGIGIGFEAHALMHGNEAYSPLSLEKTTPVFSPGSTEEVVGLIEGARKTLDIEMYYFSSTVLKEAVVEAHERGVVVRVILEPRVEANGETAEFFKNNGIEVRWAAKEFANTHAKTAIADGEKVLVGSINFSQSALERNREAAVILEGTLVQEFSRIFDEDWNAANVA